MLTYTDASLSLSQACENGNFPEGGNEGQRVATPTSFSIFNFYDIKSLWFKFDHDIFAGFKMPRL